MKVIVEPALGAESDPVWGDVAATPTPAQAPPAHEPVVVEEAEQPSESKPKPTYIRRAARVKAPKPPKPLADAHDPETGRRRVTIAGVDYEVGSGGIADIGWENF